MTHDELVRALLFACATVIVIGSLAEMWYGPRRQMTWAQWLRYLMTAIGFSTLMVAQYNHRLQPLTNYTIAFAVAAVAGALGFAPWLKRPMRKPKP